MAWETLRPRSALYPTAGGLALFLQQTLVPDSATHTPAPASPVHQAPTRVWGNFEGKAATVLKPGELSSECGVVEAWGAAGAVARGHQCCLWLSGRLLRCLLISVNVPTQESEEQRSPERMFTLSLR